MPLTWLRAQHQAKASKKTRQPGNNFRSDAYHAETAHLLGMLVGVCAIRQVAWVIAMNDVIYSVLGEECFQKIRGQVVRHSCAHWCSQAQYMMMMIRKTANNEQNDSSKVAITCRWDCRATVQCAHAQTMHCPMQLAWPKLLLCRSLSGHSSQHELQALGLTVPTYDE